MKTLKKFTLILLCILTCAALIVSSAFSAAAAPSVEGYGTFEDGIIPNGAYYTGYHNPIPYDFETFPNGDFQKGLMYWTTGNGKKPTQNVKLMSEGSNYFIQITAEAEYDGIETPRFVDDRVNVGDKLVTIYDWRGSQKHNIQVYLQQSGVGYGLRLTGGTKLVKEAQNANDWNTSIALNSKAIAEPDDGGQLFLGFGAQAFQDKNCTTQIDNIRIGRIDPATNDVHDLEGNFICNLGPVKVEQNNNNGNNNNNNNNSNSNTNNTNNSTNKPEDSKDNTETVGAQNNNTETDKGGLDNKDIIMIVVASIAGVAIIAVIVVAVLTLKKPKKQ